MSSSSSASPRRLTGLDLDEVVGVQRALVDVPVGGVQVGELAAPGVGRRVEVLEDPVAHRHQQLQLVAVLDRARMLPAVTGEPARRRRVDDDRPRRQRASLRGAHGDGRRVVDRRGGPGRRPAQVDAGQGVGERFVGWPVGDHVEVLPAVRPTGFDPAEDMVRVVGPVAVDGGRRVGVQGELLDVHPVRLGALLPRQWAAQDQQVGDDVGAGLTVGARRQPERGDQVDLGGQPAPPRRVVGVQREP